MGELGKRYKARIEAMIEELRADERIYVASASIAPPTAEAQLKEVEARLKHPLPADMRDVYEEIGGLELIWRLVKPGEDRAGLVASEPDLNDLLDYSTPYPAVVQLLGPKGWAHDWGDQANFQDEDYEELFGQIMEYDMGDGEMDYDSERMQLYLIDQYSMWIMAGVTFSPAGEAVVLIGDDHGACFSDHKQVSFPTYLDLIIKSWGLSARARPLKQMFGWDQVVSAEELPSYTLDEAIAQIKADSDDEEE